MQKLNNKIIASYQSGFTLLEILIVIAIISILAAAYFNSIKQTNFQKLKMAGEKMASDINYARNLAISRATYNGSYYPGSYGVAFYNGDGSTTYSRYIIYAGNKSNVIKTVTLSDKTFRLVDPNMSPFNINQITSVSFAFISENKVSASDFKLNSNGEYQIAIMQLVPIQQGAYTYNTYNKFFVSLGSVSGDNYAWGGGSLSYDYISPVCGNGKLETEAGEECDLGSGNSDTGYCLLSCKINECGDNHLYLGVEECDSPGIRTCPDPTQPVWCYRCGTDAICDPIYQNQGSCVWDELGACRHSSFGCSAICRVPF
ncbi:MAG: prepilin-type N-terminal cleavage/methylation domain-containing protein [Patescibacteria group bacterium]